MPGPLHPQRHRGEPGREQQRPAAEERHRLEVRVRHEPACDQQGEANDETDFEFLPNGDMLCTARLEVKADSPFGHADASTLLALAPPPYEHWTYRKSKVTRLDGPALFAYDGRVYAVGRHQPGPFGPLTKLGSMLSRKRTSLYLVEPERLVYLSDLPSAGDTSYAGVVQRVP